VQAGSILQMRFEVADTGIGIAKDVQEKLLSKFTQADSSITRRYGGTGLGLAICKHLVDLMGGKISIESEPGKGTTFSFTACFDTATTMSVLAPGDAAPGAAPAGDAPKRSLMILIVEDNAANQLLTSATLELMGHRSDIVESGIEAIEAAKRKRYDLILMDINMPKMDGIEAAGKVRELDGANVEVPIVALTANALKGDRDRFLAAGMNDYLAKPMDRKKLAAAIERWGGRNAAGAVVDPAPEAAPAPVVESEAAGDSEAAPGAEDEAAGLPVLDEDVIEDWKTFLPPEKFDELVEMQVGGARQAILKLEEAARNGAFDDLGNLAHDLKGAGANLGMVRVH
jgi:CheY-like chemotaxis protein